MRKNILMFVCSVLTCCISQDNLPLRNEFQLKEICKMCETLPDGRSCDWIVETNEHNLYEARRANELKDFVLYCKSRKRWYLFESYSYDVTVDDMLMTLNTVVIYDQDFNKECEIWFPTESIKRLNTYYVIKPSADVKLEYNPETYPELLEPYVDEVGLLPIMNLPAEDALIAIDVMIQG